MFQIITVLIFLIYLGLVYKFRKDNIVLLLLTLIAILTLCNLKNVVEGQAPLNNSTVNSNNNSKVNSNNNSTVNSNNSKVSSNNNSVNGPRPDDRLRFVVSADYQMGPYDGLVLTTGNDKSKYLKLNDVSLATKKDMCVYQGAELPLECNKTLYSGMGPSVTGVAGDDQNMFMFYRNKSSPNCCPSTFSTSTGCVCTTQDQRDYIARRGMVSSNQ
tara:strand:+ start:296 stop:940 length:645 start_codon:yes stop_codon:yes gene_type:complete